MTIRKRITPSLYNIQDLGANTDKFENVYTQNLFADNIEVTDQTVNSLTINNLTVNNLIDGNENPTIFDIISNKAHKFDVSKNIIFQGAFSGSLNTDFEDNSFTVDTYLNLQNLTASIGQVLNEDLLNLEKYNILISNLGFSSVENISDNLLLDITNSANNTLGKYILNINNSVEFLNDQLGQINGIATLDNTGKIPLSQIPTISFSNTYVVTDITERDQLSVEEGDIAILSSTNNAYMWNGADWIPIENNISLNLQQGEIAFSNNNSIEGNNRLKFDILNNLSDKSLIIGSLPNFETTIKTNLSIVEEYNGTFAAITAQNKSNGDMASSNIYLKDESASEVSGYSVFGMNNQNYNSGVNYITERQGTTYIASSDGDLSLAANFNGNQRSGSIHLGYNDATKAISITNAGAISVGTTFDAASQTYTYHEGNEGDVLVSGGSQDSVSWISTDTLLNNVKWIKQSFIFNDIHTENGSQYILTSNDIQKISNIPQLKVILNGIELNDAEYSVPALPKNRINLNLSEGIIENGDIVKVWYIKI